MSFCLDVGEVYLLEPPLISLRSMELNLDTICYSNESVQNFNMSITTPLYKSSFNWRNSAQNLQICMLHADLDVLSLQGVSS